jgi:hypothetical protein
MDSTPIRTFKFLELGKSYTHKKDPMERFSFFQLATPLTNEEKRAIWTCLSGMRVPIGFSANIKNMVSMSELKVSGYNTQDCHTILSLFLVIAIRADNHPYLKIVITRMCYFFNAISKKVINVVELNAIRKELLSDYVSA